MMQTAAAPFDMDAFANNTMQAESGGNPNARNPNSTATGLFQFTMPTWQGLAQKYPQDGYTPDNITDTDMQRAALNRSVYSEYMPALRNAGLPITQGTVYLAHGFGPSAATALLSASADTPASQVLGKSWPSIQAANPNIRKLGDGATAGDLVGQTVARIGQPMPQMGAGGDNPNDAQTATTTLSDGPTETALSEPIPDAPETEKIEDPEEHQSTTTKLLNALALWGSGANGQDFASGLGAGARALAENNDQNENRSVNIATHNADIAQADWRNQVAAVQARTAQAKALQQARLDRARGIENSLQSGLSLQSALALNSDPTGQPVTMQYDPTQRYRGLFGGGSQGYQTPQNLEVAKPDGTVEHWTQAFNKRNGQSVFTNESTGEQQGTRPDGAYDPAQTPQKEIMDQAQKDAAAFGSQVTQLDKMADNANQVLSFLPYVKPGASMPAMAARDLSQITGMPVMGNDPSAQQAMSAALGQLRTNALQQDRGLGALRMPEINEAMKSTLNLSQNPQAIHYLAAETQNKADYASKAAQAWDDLPLDNPYRTRLGFNSFLRNYKKDNPYKALSWKDAQASYQDPQASDQFGPEHMMPQSQPTAAARIGPAQGAPQQPQQAPQAAPQGQTQNGVTWSIEQ